MNETAKRQCFEISELFWSGLYATRKCLDGGIWDEVDMSQCTIKDNDNSSFIIYSIYLQTTENINSSILTSKLKNEASFSISVYLDNILCVLYM